MKRFKIVLFMTLFMAFGITSPLYAQAGPSGTGKTLTASLLGKTLGSSEQEAGGMGGLAAVEDEEEEEDEDGDSARTAETRE